MFNKDTSMKNPSQNTFLSRFQIKSICLRPSQDQLFIQGLSTHEGKLKNTVFTISYRLFDALCGSHLGSREHNNLCEAIADALVLNQPRWHVFKLEDHLEEPFLLQNIGLHFSTPNFIDERPHIQRFTQIFELKK